MLMAEGVMGKIHDKEDTTEAVKYLIMFGAWLAAMQEKLP